MICKHCGEYDCELIDSRITGACYDKFKDESGFFHIHNKNRKSSKFKCKNGHEFSVPIYFHCWCGWSSHYPEKEFHKEENREIFNEFLYATKPPHTTWFDDLKEYIKKEP